MKAKTANENKKLRFNRTQTGIITQANFRGLAFKAQHKITPTTEKRGQKSTYKTIFFQSTKQISDEEDCTHNFKANIIIHKNQIQRS